MSALDTKSPPESLFTLDPDASTRLAKTDALTAIATRSEAMLEILIEYLHDREDETGEYNESLLVNFLWQLSGNMALIRNIASDEYKGG